MPDARIVQAVKANATLLVVLGIAMIFFGVLALCAPLVAGLAIEYMIGVLVLAGGIAQCFFAFKANTFGGGLSSFAWGLLSVIVGGLLISEPLTGLGILTLLLIAYFFVTGVCEIALAFQVKPEPGWPFPLISGLISLLVGILLWSEWPLSGAWAIGVLVGIKLLFTGSALMQLGLAARRLAKAAA